MMTKGCRLPGFATLALVALVAASPTQAQPADGARGAFDVQLAVERSRGHYGETELTRITTRTATFRYRGQAFVAELEVPWLEIRTNAAQGGLPGQAGRGGSLERGIGDAWIKFNWELREAEVGQTGLDLGLKIKTRSGDWDNGLGSGGTDVALQLEWMRPLGGVTAFGEIGWRKTGDVKGARPYHDPWYGELGLMGNVVPSLEVGAYVDARERIGSLGSLLEFTAYGAWKFDGHKLQLYWTRGTTKASPDQALGLSWRTRF